MRNHLAKRVLHRAWMTKPSDREAAFSRRRPVVNHLTGYKGLQIREEQLGPLRWKHMLGQTPAARADRGVRRSTRVALFHTVPFRRYRVVVCSIGRRSPQQQEERDSGKLAFIVVAQLSQGRRLLQAG